MSSTDYSGTRPGAPTSIDNPPVERASAASAADETRVRDSRAELANRLMTAIIQKLQSEQPENVHSYVELGVKVIEATYTTSPRERAEIERRQAGMWLGSVMATVCIIGGVIAGTSIHFPAIISITLLCLGAACAGATFAIITGNNVRADELLNAMTALTKLTVAGNQNEEKK